MSNLVGRLSPGVWVYPGDPTGAPVSAFNPPAGVIVLDSNGGAPRIKKSAKGSNATFERIVDGEFRTVTTAYAASVTPNSETTDIVRITLTGNITLNAPSGTPTHGQTLDIEFTQDSTGGRTVTYSNISVPTPTEGDPGDGAIDAGASKLTIVRLRYHTTKGWLIVTVIPGY